MSLFISSGYCVYLALLILLLPIHWILPVICASFVHELCHYVAILFCTGKTTGVGLYSFAARIRLPEMGRGKELICSVAGPLGGLLICLLAPWFPRLAFCALLQSAYNLLPIYPLDGGRALRCLLRLMMRPVSADMVATFTQWLTIGAVTMLSLYLTIVLKMGMFPIIAAAVLVFHANDAKMPCNSERFPLQ